MSLALILGKYTITQKRIFIPIVQIQTTNELIPTTNLREFRGQLGHYREVHLYTYESSTSWTPRYITCFQITITSDGSGMLHQITFFPREQNRSSSEREYLFSLFIIIVIMHNFKEHKVKHVNLKHEY